MLRSRDHIKHFGCEQRTANSSNLGPRAGLLNVKARMQQKKKTSEDKMEIQLELFQHTKYDTI